MPDTDQPENLVEMSEPDNLPSELSTMRLREHLGRYAALGQQLTRTDSIVTCRELARGMVEAKLEVQAAERAIMNECGLAEVRI